MDLLIKTTADQTWLGLVESSGRLVDQRQLPTNRQLSQSLVEASCQLVEANGSWPVLTGIGVWAGPGPFTALRVVHSFANGLAYGRQLPAANSVDPDNWQADCQRQLRTGRRQILTPVYGAPAVRPPKSA